MGSPIENTRIVSASQTYILYTSNLKICVSAQKAAKDVVVKVFIG